MDGGTRGGGTAFWHGESEGAAIIRGESWGAGGLAGRCVYVRGIHPSVYVAGGGVYITWGEILDNTAVLSL